MFQSLVSKEFFYNLWPVAILSFNNLFEISILKATFEELFYVQRLSPMQFLLYHFKNIAFERVQIWCDAQNFYL